MPYIPRVDRLRLNYYSEARRALTKSDLQAPKPGELNYMLTRIILAYFDTAGMNYTTLNAVMGVLECVKQELYRRVAVPYENKKRTENGDVYDA